MSMFEGTMSMFEGSESYPPVTSDPVPGCNPTSRNILRYIVCHYYLNTLKHDPMEMSPVTPPYW